MASRQPLDRETFDMIAAQDDRLSRPTPLAQEQLAVYLTSGRAITLTDDFVPVDQLLANLFIERGN